MDETRLTNTKLDETVSRFLIDTCTDEHGVNIRFTLARIWNDINLGGYNYSIPAGSISELYINPMISCIGDHDIMRMDAKQLAVQRSDLHQQRLPSMYGDRVKVYEMIDTQFPGYVLLKEIRELCRHRSENMQTFCPGFREYYNKPKTFVANIVNKVVHGPAVMFNNTEQVVFRKRLLNVLPKSRDHDNESLIDCVLSIFPNNTDMIFSIHCLKWPTQAADWRTRYREFGWPDATTIEYIVSNGCDLVQVAHRQCRQDKWASEHQWRLSFSKAETVLLTSWTPTQQIVYHVLRYIFNHENLGDFKESKNDYKILSKYHIKTLLMWTCEIKHPTWWVRNNIVELCCLLMKDLADCCEVGRYRSYFIMSNLFECPEDCTELTSLVRRLEPFTDVTFMTHWLVRNYVGECVQMCSKDVQRLFDDISTNNKLQLAVNAMIKWRKNSWDDFEKSIINLLSMNIYGQISEDIAKGFSPLDKTTEVYLEGWRWVSGVVCASLLDNTNVFVKMLKKFVKNSFPLVLKIIGQLWNSMENASLIFNYVVLNVVTALISTTQEFAKLTARIPSSTYLLRKAVFLMESSMTSSGTTDSSIKLFLSHFYLCRALAYEDNWSEDSYDVTYCAANMYLAVLYYITGQYKTASNHCEQVLSAKQPSTQTSSHLVKGQCLPKIDDDVDNALGLVVLYNFLKKRSNELHQQVECDVFSPNLMACYLQLMSNFHNKTSLNNRKGSKECIYSRPAALPLRCDQTTSRPKSLCYVKRYTNTIRDTRAMFITDIILRYRSKKWTDTKVLAVKSPTPLSSLRFNSTDLQRLLWEHSLEQLTMCYGTPITLLDVEAILSFHLDDYEHCYELSELNVMRLLDEHQFGEVRSIKMACFTDNNLQSIAAAAVLIQRPPEDSSMAEVYTVSELTLSLCLSVECKMKLKHPVTSLVDELRRITLVRSMMSESNYFDKLILSLLYRRVYIHVRREDRRRNARK